MLYTTSAPARIGEMPSPWSAFIDNHVQHFPWLRVLDFALVLYSLSGAFVFRAQGPRTTWAMPSFLGSMGPFRDTVPLLTACLLDSWVPLGLLPWSLPSWLTSFQSFISVSPVGNWLTKPYEFLISASGWWNVKTYNACLVTICLKHNHVSAAIPGAILAKDS